MSILTIVAGPNGAGKSTYSKELLSESGIEAFDFDKEFYSLWSQFSFDPAIEQGAFNRAQDLYIERRTEALLLKNGFAFETNYHTDDVLKVVEQFKANGYRIELIFICLDNPEAAIDRVKQRVLEGGHSVDELTIRERFESRLRRLDLTFDQYDLVTIYTSRENSLELSVVLDPTIEYREIITPVSISVRRYLKRLEEYVG